MDRYIMALELKNIKIGIILKKQPRYCDHLSVIGHQHLWVQT